MLRWKRGGDSDSLMIPNADHRAALAQLLPMVQNAAGGKLHGIGHRVVHGGELFTHATRIDDRVVEAIRHRRWRRCTTRPTCKASRQR